MLESNQDMMAQYNAVSFEINFSFPILIVKKAKIIDDEKNGFDPNAINLKLPQLFRMNGPWLF